MFGVVARSAVAAFMLTLFAASALAEDPARALVPLGERRATIMAVRYSPRCAEVAQKFQRAIQKDAEWWLEQVKKAPPGEPVPYSPRMGLTSSEYQEFLSCATSMTMQEVGETRLRVTTTDGRVFKFSTSTPELGLDGIELDLEKNEVRTPLGVVRERSSILADSTRDSPTGPWEGHSWKGNPGPQDLSSVEGATGSTIRFSLGRRLDKGGILYYNATRLENGVKTARFMTVLYYAPNTTATPSGAKSRPAARSR